MQLLQLSQLQSERNKWVKYNFGDSGEMPSSLLGAVEELGELSHSYLKMHQGIRGTDDEHRENMADAVGDCVIYLAGVCTYLKRDYGVVVQQTWDQVKTRDWVKYPGNGVDK